VALVNRNDPDWFYRLLGQFAHKALKVQI
jgi:hypothetical protein